MIYKIVETRICLNDPSTRKIPHEKRTFFLKSHTEALVYKNLMLNNNYICGKHTYMVVDIKFKPYMENTDV